MGQILSPYGKKKKKEDRIIKDDFGKNRKWAGTLCRKDYLLTQDPTASLNICRKTILGIKVLGKVYTPGP